MVDEVRVLRLLRAVTDDLAVLRAEASADDERRRDPLSHGVIDAGLAEADAVVVSRLHDLGDLESFVRQVAALLGRT